jgi:hypothetical protein
MGTIASPWRYDLPRWGTIFRSNARGHVPQRCDRFGIGLSPVTSVGIDPRDFNAGGDQFSQPVLDLGHKLRITTAHRNGMSGHFGKVVGRERQARNPARVDLEGPPSAPIRPPLTNKY